MDMATTHLLELPGAHVPVDDNVAKLWRLPPPGASNFREAGDPAAAATGPMAAESGETPDQAEVWPRFIHHSVNSVHLPLESRRITQRLLYCCGGLR
jgi:hypothetical protein